jgi:hypothetical protein
LEEHLQKSLRTKAKGSGTGQEPIVALKQGIKVRSGGRRLSLKGTIKRTRSIYKGTLGNYIWQ